MDVSRIRLHIGIPRRRPIRLNKEKIIRITRDYNETETIDKTGSKTGDHTVQRKDLTAKKKAFEEPEGI